MAKRIDPQDFIDALLPVVDQCARATLIFFGQVTDIGKAADRSLLSDHAQDASTAFTVLDGAVQDILLAAVLQHFPQVRCIAEERTPLKKSFAGNTSPYTVILDPIDGTYHFKRGDAPYHITIGLARDGEMLASIVARPSEDKTFTAIKGEGAYVQIGKRRPRRLRLPKKPRTNKAFISSKARPHQVLARPNFDPRERPIGAALVLTQLAEGEVCAYLTRQVEIYDAGPPSLIAEEAGARCYIGEHRRPAYTQRRKFGYFVAAANDDIAAQLFAIIRQVKRNKVV
jgi:myo-inositol-1(or 4)-monophosphatase